MEPIEVIDYKNHVIKIYPDEDPMNPREWDNLGIMVCFHSRYDLGDLHTNYTIKDVKRIANSKKYISLPVYLYDHSGLTMNTSGFSCRWDSGQVGFIFVSKEKVRKEYGWKAISRKRHRKILQILINEVSTYSLYLEGGFVGFDIEDGEGKSVDGCWGFDDQDYAISEAKSIVDCLERR